MQEVFEDKAVGSFLNENFICKKLNTSNPLQILRANDWGITDVPSLVFFDCRGKVVYTCSGYRQPEQVIAAAQKAMDIMTMNARKWKEQEMAQK